MSDKFPAEMGPASLRAAPTVSFELKLPVELNSESFNSKETVGAARRLGPALKGDLKRKVLLIPCFILELSTILYY